MRKITIAALLASLPLLSLAAPTWQLISAEPGKRIELDRTSIKREGNSVQAQGRVILERELTDPRTGSGYRVIEAITRYDCGERNANTLKRIYKKNEKDVIREEELKGTELPVRSGTLDDKVLREVCRPAKDEQSEVAQKANDAASQLKQANEALLKKELAKTDKSALIKTSDSGHDSPIPTITPNLKAALEAEKAAAQANANAMAFAKSANGEAAKPTPATPTPAPAAKPQTLYVHAPAPAKPRKAAAKEGYMLEIAHKDAAEQHAHMHWGYEGPGGPESWSKLDPKNTVCATGNRQSPIDIKDGIKVDLEPIKFNYRPSNFRVVDNGHTIQVNLSDSSITLTGKTYELLQFHFHRPSEEKVNGQRFDMVAHLVHRDFDNNLAVVAVLMEKGMDNPFIQTLWNYMPLEVGMSVEPPDVVIDLSKLLPEKREYYTYMGSLTTPPCTENVLWMVFKEPIMVSPEQIGIFTRLYPHNARPIQPTHDRLIKESR